MWHIRQIDDANVCGLVCCLCIISENRPLYARAPTVCLCDLFDNLVDLLNLPNYFNLLTNRPCTPSIYQPSD